MTGESTSSAYRPRLGRSHERVNACMKRGHFLPSASSYRGEAGAAYLPLPYISTLNPYHGRPHRYIRLIGTKPGK